MTIRQREPRVHIPSLAVLVLDGGRWIGPFEVENLSVAGALLTGTMIQSVSLLRVGTSVGVRLQLPGIDPIMDLDAKVVRAVEGARSTAESFSFAVEFLDVEKAHQDLIGGAVLRALEDSRTASERVVVVIDPSQEDGRMLVELLRSLDRRALHASNLVDGMRMLQNQSLHVDVALVDVPALCEHAVAFDVVGFLAEQFPVVRLIIISKRADDPELHGARSFGRVAAILLKPPTREDLACAIGLEAF